MAASEMAVWIEIVASLAVLVTLVFLTVQIRQANALMRSEARQAQMINDQEHIYKIIQHPDIAASFTSQGTIGDEEKTRLMFWIVASMRARENEWFQYRQGVLDATTWASYRQVIPFTLGTQRARALWHLCQVFFDSEFVEIVDEMIEGEPAKRVLAGLRCCGVVTQAWGRSE